MDELKEKLVKATMDYIKYSRVYDETGDDVYEHMMLEDKKYNALEEMERLYDLITANK